MGWSAKHGLRPNRPRPLREPGTRKIIKRPPREPGYRVVGVLNCTKVNVHAVPKGFFRRTITLLLRLHPTKGWRIENNGPEIVDFSPSKLPPSDWIRGRHITNTFKRAAA